MDAPGSQDSSNQPRQRNWFERNWKWVVPVGCAGLAVLFAAFFASIFIFVFASMRQSWAFSEGLELARTNEEVIEALGEPIEARWFVFGTINRSGDGGHADISVPIRGPRGSATLYVIARREAGEWHLELAQVAIKGRSGRIDLLERRMIFRAAVLAPALDTSP
jgi:hypothetical protein